MVVVSEETNYVMKYNNQKMIKQTHKYRQNDIYRITIITDTQVPIFKEMDFGSALCETANTKDQSMRKMSISFIRYRRHDPNEEHMKRNPSQRINEI